ncbi:MAG: hypothetical protein ABIE75_05430 [Candidatus Omnitrophota bacterium]
MTEQSSEKKTCLCSKSGLKVIAGIVLVIAGLAAVIKWWLFLTILLKGCIGLLLIMAGAIAIAIAKE